jgi:hypothetical protein
MLATAIYHDPNDVDARLAELHLKSEILIDALLQANLYHARLTRHHPSLYRYSVLTAETVAALRDALVPLGWEKLDEGHYELAFNSRLNMGIAVASGDEGTGNKDRIASNKSEKGPRTANAVRNNQTADLFPETLPANTNDETAIDTWILLHRRVGNEIRLELSRPNDYDATERFVTSWSERILLGPILLDDDRKLSPVSQLPDVDFVISRKSA